MRLTAFRFDQWPRDAALLADLGKLYDAPALAALAATVNAGKPLVTARFNDHHLAAALLELDSEPARLSQLVVREVTRRRGVGRFLVDEAATIAAEAGAQQLQLLAVDNDACCAFAAACGFTGDGYTLALINP